MCCYLRPVCCTQRIYIYIYVHIHTRIFLYVCMHACMFVYVCKYVRMYVCTHVRTCVRACVRACVRTYVCMYVSMETHTHMSCGLYAIAVICFMHVKDVMFVLTIYACHMSCMRCEYFMCCMCFTCSSLYVHMLHVTRSSHAATHCMFSCFI